jgi:hypothetical protein
MQASTILDINAQLIRDDMANENEESDIQTAASV